MNMGYPKVLIVGNYFELSSGGGITMTNLFKGWDIERIAVAGERIKNPDYSVCRTYYQLGYPENKRRFPFFLWQKHDSPGLLAAPIPGARQSHSPMIPPVSKKMDLYNRLLH